MVFKMGDASLSQIPPQRAVAYGVVAGLLPIFLSLAAAWNMISDAEQSRAYVQTMEQTLLSQCQQQAVNRFILYKFQGKDPFYLNKTVEPYQPLKRENEILKTLQSKAFLPDSGAQERRLKYLAQSENRFNFVESAAAVLPLFKETLEVQSRPVEVDNSDLSAILQYVEGSEIDGAETQSKPQLIVVEASLERKKGYDQEAWALSLKLLKRIYTASIEKI